jgi:hypothetical protein
VLEGAEVYGRQEETGLDGEAVTGRMERDSRAVSMEGAGVERFDFG